MNRTPRVQPIFRSLRLQSRAQDGFTLLESVVAILVVGTSLVAGISLLGVQQQALATTDLQDAALRQLSIEMEKVRGTPVRELSAKSWEVIAEDPRFECNRDVEPWLTTSVRVTCTVRWDDRNGQSQQIAAATLRSEVR